MRLFNERKLNALLMLLVLIQMFQLLAKQHALIEVISEHVYAKIKLKKKVHVYVTSGLWGSVTVITAADKSASFTTSN